MSTQPNRFREHRERVGMTQAEVAAKIGISIPTVARHEGGSRLPSPALAEQYAELYGVMSAELFVWLYSMAVMQLGESKPNRLKEIREDSILTGGEVARLIGTFPERNAEYESGETPPKRTIKKYAEVYKVTTAELFVKLPAYTTSEG